MDARLPRVGGESNVDVRRNVAGASGRQRTANQTGQMNPLSTSNMPAATEAIGSYADLALDENAKQNLGPVVISMRNVTKVYPAQPNRPALANITLDIRSGEFLFLVGHSGSGKSTFIRMLNREIVPTSGELIVAGENLRTIKSWRIPYLRRSVGCVFQDFKLLPNKTAFENVAFALEVIGKSRHVIRTQVPEVLRLVGLEEKMDKLPDQLSGGEQQRVSIARSIVHRFSSATSRPAISTPRPPWASCACSSALIARARRSSSPRTIAKWSTRCVVACSRSKTARSSAIRRRECMATMSKILYFLKESVVSSRRNLGTTIGGIVTIFLSLLMIGVTIIISIMIGNLATSFEDEVNVRLYIADEATDEQIASLDSYLKTLENDKGNIASVDFRNKDQVLEDFQRQTANNPDIVNQLDGNPLPRTYVITLRDTHKVQDTVGAILGNEAFTSIADNPEDPSDSIKYGQGTVERLFAVTNVIRYACIVAVVLLVFISLVFLNNTIRLAILARRREISIMRLVGATNGFIRGPFVTEGALQALVGAVFAIIVLSLVRVTVFPALENMVSFLPLTVDAGVYSVIYLVLIIAGVLIGMLGSAIAMRRYLKV